MSLHFDSDNALLCPWCHTPGLKRDDVIVDNFYDNRVAGIMVHVDDLESETTIVEKEEGSPVPPNAVIINFFCAACNKTAPLKIALLKDPKLVSIWWD